MYDAKKSLNIRLSQFDAKLTLSQGRTLLNSTSVKMVQTKSEKTPKFGAVPSSKTIRKYFSTENSWCIELQFIV